MKRDFFRAFLAKDREIQGRSNPLFPAQKKPLWRKILILLSLLTVLVGGGYLGFRYITQPSFYISNVSTNGLLLVNATDVTNSIEKYLKSHAVFIFPKNHRWFFKEDEFKSFLENEYPFEVTNITVSKDHLTVDVLEDLMMAAVHNGGSWQLVTLAGQSIRELNAEEIPLMDDPDSTGPVPYYRLPKIELESPLDPTRTEGKYFDENFYGAIVLLDEQARTLGLTPERYVIERADDDWLKLETREKPYSIFVDIKKDIPGQFFMLETVMSKYEHNESDISYIDVRFGNHVYVK